MAKWICNVGTVRVEADSLPQFMKQVRKELQRERSNTTNKAAK
jgi:hypothetical protein